MPRHIPPRTRKSVKFKMYMPPECPSLRPATSVSMWEYKRYAIWEGAVALLREGTDGLMFSILWLSQSGERDLRCENCTCTCLSV